MEKLVLPFNFETWTGLGVTFLLATITIFIINRLPRKIRKLFYGKATSVKVLNIFQKFFGIGEKKLLEVNVARIVLISFIFWCLVMRTAYQGKLFEFTTTAIKKPEFKILEELRARNYTLYLPDFLEGKKTTDHFLDVIK